MQSSSLRDAARHNGRLHAHFRIPFGHVRIHRAAKPAALSLPPAPDEPVAPLHDERLAGEAARLLIFAMLGHVPTARPETVAAEPER